MKRDATYGWRPPFPYTPGRTPRHDEALFDPLKDDLSPDALTASTAWGYGWAFLRDGYFWEAHEMFEAVWMACPPNTAEKLLVQSLIQHANAGLKRRMGRETAADRLSAEAERLAGEALRRAGGPVLGVGDLELAEIRSLAL